MTNQLITTKRQIIKLRAADAMDRSADLLADQGLYDTADKLRAQAAAKRDEV